MLLGTVPAAIAALGVLAFLDLAGDGPHGQVQITMTKCRDERISDQIVDHHTINASTTASSIVT